MSPTKKRSDNAISAAPELVEATAKKPDAGLRYTLKVTMRDIKPPVWRRIQVPGDIVLGNLVRILIQIMGFDNSHLSSLSIDGVEYEVYGEGSNPLFGGMSRSMRLKLCDLVTQPKSKFTYLYDYGDSWRYTIVLEKIDAYSPDDKRKAVCIAGKGDYFQEDVGGTRGYQYTVEILSDPSHEDHDEWVEMHGPLEEFIIPFDIDKLNKRLASLKE